jgi:hypothetical protein
VKSGGQVGRHRIDVETQAFKSSLQKLFAIDLPGRKRPAVQKRHGFRDVDTQIGHEWRIAAVSRRVAFENDSALMIEQKSLGRFDLFTKLFQKIDGSGQSTVIGRQNLRLHTFEAMFDEAEMIDGPAVEFLENRDVFGINLLFQDLATLEKQVSGRIPQQHDRNSRGIQKQQSIATKAQKQGRGPEQQENDHAPQP